MKLFERIFVIVVGTLVVSAILTPLVYSGAVSIWTPFPWPFSRVFDRVAMVVLAGFLVWYRRAFRLERLLALLRSDGFPTAFARVLLGMIVTFSMSIILLPYIVDGVALQWKDQAVHGFGMRLLKVVPAALLISVIEESFFRVILFLSLRASFGGIAAGIVSSILYAFAHFITPAKDWIYPGLSPTVGFAYLGEVCQRLALPGVLEAGIGLFLVGCVLCFAMWRVRSVWLCIGFHAGWVIAVKLTGYFTIQGPNFEFAAGAGRRYFLVSQPEAWVSVASVALFVLVYALIAKVKPQEELGSSDIDE
ncbi:MAG: CPBP family intramembrane metalloprotease [Bdellovibrionales bacterium]|nr:CPBP family intramembrane metalloprotease [Bdellovibrionales bacterium]